MRVCIFGAGGFIGMNLADFLVKESNHYLVLCDKNIDRLEKYSNLNNVEIRQIDYINDKNFDDVLTDIDIIFNLISTCVPGNVDFNLKKDIAENSMSMINCLDSCVKNNVKKIIFLSSGGAIYGNKNKSCSEKDETNPISSYGLQKLLLEKIIFLYNYRFGLHYNIIRLSNPYGPYQKPNRGQGVINTFLFNIYNDKILNIFGDGNNIRDYIYIKDAIKMIVNVSFSNTDGIFNIGSGKGMSINDLVIDISNIIGKKPVIKYLSGRLNDVKVNTLDITKYKKEFGNPILTPFESGIKDTLDYLLKGI